MEHSLETIESLERAVAHFMARPDLAEFESLALRIYRFQFANNTPYRLFAAQNSRHRSPSRWEDIPAVPQDAFKHATLIAFAPSAITSTFRTSGTTGRGHGLHHFRDTTLYKKSIIHGWRACGLPEIRRLVLIPPGHLAPHSSLSHMMSALETLRGSQQFVTDDNGAPNFDRLVTLVQSAVEPVMIMGTALTFLHLLDYLDGRILPLPEGSFLWETGGYKSLRRSLPKTEFYAALCECFGISSYNIFNEYGMTELSSQFYAAGLDQPHRAPPWLRARVIAPDTSHECAIGDTGFLRIYDLANIGSVLAVETQDLAVRHESGFVLLGRDPAALPRGCSLSSEELLARADLTS